MRELPSRRFGAVLGALALLLTGLVAQRSAAAEEDGWTFSLSPYLWAAGLEGDVRIGRLPTTSVDLSFSDVFRDLNGALMLQAGARKGRLLLEGDLMYVKTVSKDGTPGPLFSGFRFENELWVVTALAGYRMVDAPRQSVDVFAGLRYWSLDADLRLDSGILRTRRGSGDESWVDPVVGARATFALADRWDLALRGTFGGFGVGADSDWGAFGGVTYTSSERMSFTAGYRHLAVDYDDSNLRYDMAITGPIVGLHYQF